MLKKRTLTVLHKSKWLLMCLCLWSIVSHGVLSLQLTAGVRRTIPIAIIPFAGQADATSPDNIAAVVAHDLKNSGHFQVTSAPSLGQKPHNASDVNFSYWQKRNQNNLVVGRVMPLPGGRYRVHFQLLNAYPDTTHHKKSAKPRWQSAILLDMHFTTSRGRLRALAHHISDLIYENLIGDRGIFATRIAYVLAQSGAGTKRHYQLEVSDVDGYNAKPLLRSSAPILSPAWSRDGSKISYVSFESGSPVVYVQDVVSGARRVLSGFFGLNTAPAWSPDGRKMALVLTRTGYPKIFVMDIASRKLTQVTQGSAIDTEPVWSSNANTLYFTSNRGGGPQIYRVNLSTRKVVRITFQGKYNASPSLSSDGKTLAVLNGGHNAYNIAVQDIPTGNYQIVTHSGSAQSPSIAPNGKMVIYAMREGGRGRLGIVSIDGRVKLRLPAVQGDVREPAWGPFTH